MTSILHSALTHDDILEIPFYNSTLPLTQDFDWTAVPVYPLAHQLWTADYGGYSGQATLRLAATPQALILLFHVQEPDDAWPPRAVATQDSESVYEDSCVEFFFRPQAAPDGEQAYINIEMNSRGVILSALGSDRHVRQSLEPVIRPLIEVQTFGLALEHANSSMNPKGVTLARTDWGLRLEISPDVFTWFNRSELTEFKPGLSLEANAYKCGDATVTPHYHALYPVTSETPNYHRPQDFGVLKLVEL